MRVHDAVRGAPVVAAPATTVAAVAALMNSEGVGAVVVVEHGAPIGIATDRDLVVRVLARRLDPGIPIIDVMSINLVTVDAQADLREATRLFANNRIRRLPVVKDGRVVGVLSVDDLVIDAVGDLATLVRPVVDGVVFGRRDRM